MRISDVIAAYIQELLEAADGKAEIQRNELAGHLGCVPSQINYVITSRFTPEQGYLVESRRGGGGYIRITQVCTDPKSALIHVINAIGDTISCTSLILLLNNMEQRKLIASHDARMIGGAASDQSLSAVPAEQRDRVRAGIVKNMLITVMNYQ